MTSTNELINRFKNYNRSELYFNHEDCGLIYEALEENKSTHGDPVDSVALLAYLASENIKTKEEYANFRSFMCDYQNQVIEFNFPNVVITIGGAAFRMKKEMSSQ